MNPPRFMTINAFLLLAFGIAFLLYAPNVLAFYQLPVLTGGSSEWFWNVISFGRMFGAVLSGLGLLTWSVKEVPDHPALPSEIGRGVLMALLLANLALTITALTQGASVWSSWAGWVTSGMFAIFSLGYAYLIWKRSRKS